MGVNAARLLLVAAFILSGFVKLVDPLGTCYKFEDYFAAFGWAGWMPAGVALGAAVLLACAEFVLGVYLLFGIRRRLTSTLLLLFMSVFTPLTLYLALTNPVADCGCFGDAWKLTNWETFGKNIVLLAAALITFRYRRYMGRVITERNQWLVSMYTLFFAPAVALVSLYHLPLMDFRPYHIGADLRTALAGEAATEAPEFETTFILEKDGKRREFTLDNYPDSTWTYVDTRTVQVGGADVRTDASLADFSLYLMEVEEDITAHVLADSGYTFLLVAPDLKQADDSNIDRINLLYDYAFEHGHAFYCLTASSPEEVERWMEISGAEYPFCRADELMLKTAVRANPGLIVLHDGKVVNKLSHYDLPTEAQLTAADTGFTRAQAFAHSRARQVLHMLMWYILPLIFFTTADRVWVLFKFYKRFKHKNKLLTLLNLKGTNMRKKIVAGNWKMNLNLQEGVALATELNNALAADAPACDVVICTPFIHLASVAGVINSEVIGLGAENCADKVSGAYTGEVSASMVKSTGAQYVILGHSERRAYYGETAEILKEKVNLALANDLKVIFCIGEVLEEREAEKQNEVVKAQLEGSLFDLTAEQFANVILAYEPVWAIGTGKTATSEQAQEMHAFIRATIAEKFGAEAAENVSILYGGSCKPDNAKDIFAKPDVDGGLIGGAALKVADFKGIIDAWK